jgi:hypothetical protein
MMWLRGYSYVHWCFRLVWSVSKETLFEEMLTLSVTPSQYESFSKRLMPEAMNFLANTLVLVAPSSCDFSVIPGVFPIPDLRSDSNRSLRLRPKSASSTIAHPKADLVALLSPSAEVNEQGKVDLLSLTFKLCAAYAELYVGLEAFLEVFGPIEEVMKRVGKANLPQSLAVSTWNIPFYSCPIANCSFTHTECGFIADQHRL